MANLLQQFQFARHIPPRQIVHRFQLSARRKIETLWPRVLRKRKEGCVFLNSTLPAPLFKSREFGVDRVDSGWRFHFLGETRLLTGPHFWFPQAGNPSDQLWHMNLHYMEYLETLDSADCLDIIRLWIAENPPYTPESWVAAWNSYSVSIRVVVWLHCIARHPETAQPDIVESLIDQIIFLERHLESDIGGNHLMKNIKALIWASASFTGILPNRWRTIGTKLLRKEIDCQILADGVHYEKSPSYHAQVFADLLEIKHALGADEMPEVFGSILEKMGLATLALSHADGGPALLNDSGLGMAYAPLECARVYEVVTGKSLFRPHHAAYRNAGYYAHHGQTFSLIVDMGRIGPDDLPAHSHGDVGTFELSVGGKRCVVDQGVFEYVEGPRRATSRATASHNCMTLDNRSQADLYGAFRCGRRPNVRIKSYAPNETGFSLSGSHDGFAPCEVMRQFDVGQNSISITDRIDGGTFGVATSGLLLHPDCVVHVDGNLASVTCEDQKIAILANVPMAIEAAVYWPDMGVELYTSRLRLTLPPDSRECRIDIMVVSGQG